ncbi:MAG: LamG-like jellyroll fold domain-containing protein, partial [Planctomycetota bacterium]
MCRKLVYSILLLVLGLMVSVAGADVTSDLVAWWALDDGSGMTAKDSAGHPGGPHDGALQNGPLWESADFKVGRGALKFDGIDDRIVVESFDLQGTGITLAAWIKPPDLATFNDPRLISKAQGGGTPDHYWAMVLSGSGEDNLEFRLRTDTGAPTRRTSPQGNDMRADEWAHLAVTWDAGDPFMRLYKNGREIDSVSKAGTAVGVGPGVRIGVGNQSVSAGSGSMDRPFPGILDDVRIYERGLSAEDITELVAWQGAPVPLTLACCPSPADEATDVPRDVVLSWTPGIFAPPISGHKVFLSENFNDVNDGIGGVTQDANSYEPAQRLDLGKTYYWRIDEVNGPPDYTVYQGDVWSFTTEPVGYPIENIIATASSMQSAAMGPENTVNGLGLNDNNLHSKDESDMWLSSVAGPQPTWIQYEFDKVYKLHQIMVWNSNQMVEPVVGFGFKDVTIEYSVNGTDYTTLGTTHQFAQAPGTPGYAYNTTVDFSGIGAKYIRLTANSNWGGILNQYGLSEVRFFHIPVQARKPYPDSGATDVDVDVVLGWRAGREAVTHDVYLSTDEQAVIDGTVSATTVTETSHGPLSVDLAQTYYWKINEVNMAETPTTWEGDLWNFATREFLVVDDFESYNDLDPTDPESRRIFNVWKDGYEVPTNGSLVGYESPPFCEQTIVHGGDQSMPLFYDNAGGAAYSEAELSLSPAQDWTKSGIRSLVLYFHGDAGNTGGQLYVKINNAKILFDGSPAAISRPFWTQWNIDLAAAGTNLAAVNTLSIGIDGAGVQGVLYVDDIRLYRQAPEVLAPQDPGTGNLVAYYAMENNTQDGSGNSHHGTPSGGPVYAPGIAGMALDFDGVDDRLDLGSVDVAGSGITLSLWLKPESYMYNDTRVISKATSTSANDHWWMMSTNGNNHVLRFRLKTNDGSNTTTLIADSGGVSEGEWIHAAATWDGSMMRIYRNLQEVGGTAKGGTAVAVDASVNAAIGNQPPGAGDKHWVGLIDEVR